MMSAPEYSMPPRPAGRATASDGVGLQPATWPPPPPPPAAPVPTVMPSVLGEPSVAVLGETLVIVTEQLALLAGAPTPNWMVEASPSAHSTEFCPSTQPP